MIEFVDSGLYFVLDENNFINPLLQVGSVSLEKSTGSGSGWPKINGSGSSSLQKWMHFCPSSFFCSFMCFHNLARKTTSVSGGTSLAPTKDNVKSVFHFWILVLTFNILISGAGDPTAPDPVFQVLRFKGLGESNSSGSHLWQHWGPEGHRPGDGGGGSE